MIKLNGIKKTYFTDEIETDAVGGISLTVSRGEFVSISGPSGSGKSTLLNLIGLMSQPSSGSYILDGQDTSKLTFDEAAKVRGQNIGIVFQSFNLLNGLSALDNIILPARLAGKDVSEAAMRAEELLSSFGLENRMKHTSETLSGGQQQRVALARALINRPGVLLLDEPTGNLDSSSAEKITQLIERTAELSETTVILVTHHIDLASRANICLKMHDGMFV